MCDVASDLVERTVVVTDESISLLTDYTSAGSTPNVIILKGEEEEEEDFSVRVREIMKKGLLYCFFFLFVWLVV